MSKVIAKYLQHYAEPYLAELSCAVDSPYDAILVLPVYDEALASLETFLAHQSTKKLAYIWVINCPNNADHSAQVRTQSLLSSLRGVTAFQSLGEGCYRGKIHDALDLFLIDRCSEGRMLPPKQGVGLARKIGLDLALKLVWETDYDAKAYPWLHCCDADVQLPDGYFDIPAPGANQSACLYPFVHQPDPGYELSMALYDFKLDYYKTGLTYAGSPYAFHTIGSIITVSPLAYAQVRGMPKRSGGEDFYFLNKLAKVGAIVELPQPKLTIAGRPSDRVPFGTGPALRDLNVLDDPLAGALYYHPKIFLAMKAVLTLAKQIKPGQSWASFSEQLSLLLDEPLYGKSHETLEALGFSEALAHIACRKDEYEVHFHTWFDAFRTLKFVHGMRNFFPSLNLSELVEHANLLPSKVLSDIDSLLKTSEYAGSN